VEVVDRRSSSRAMAQYAGEPLWRLHITAHGVKNRL
jgi:hypothetical protein